jgi:hypothetical protein
MIKPAKKWKEVYGDSDNPALFREWLRLVLDPARKYDFGEGYGLTDVSPLVGVLGWRFIRLYWKDLAPVFEGKRITFEDLVRLDSELNILDYTIRNENLEADTVAALKAAGLDLSEESEAAMRAGPSKKTNMSKHEAVEFYYDKETVDLVNQKERFLIQKYGYRPPAL